MCLGFSFVFKTIFRCACLFLCLRRAIIFHCCMLFLLIYYFFSVYVSVCFLMNLCFHPCIVAWLASIPNIGGGGGGQNECFRQCCTFEDSSSTETSNQPKRDMFMSVFNLCSCCCFPHSFIGLSAFLQFFSVCLFCSLSEILIDNKMCT